MYVSHKYRVNLIFMFFRPRCTWRMNLKALFPIKALNCGITEAYSISGKLVESPHSLLLLVLGRHLGR